MYLLDATTIKSPQRMNEQNSTQFAQNRTMAGDVTRDYFGENKRIWELEYRNIKKTDYDTINTIYQDYLDTNTAKTWQVTETNYAVSATDVHVDLRVRQFSVGGEGYISDFDLILTEA